MIGIYKIENMIDHKVYIGQSVRVEQRWKEHISYTHGPQYRNYPLYNAMNKYGIDNFSFTVLEECEADQLYSREQYWIDYYNSTDLAKGYNLRNAQGPEDYFSKAKLTKEDVIFIRNCQLDGIPRRDVYKYFKDKISLSGFSQCWVGKSWAYIMPEAVQYIKDNHNVLQSSTKHVRATLSRETVIQIRTLKKQGVNCYQAHKQFKDIPETTFRRVWNNVTYKDIIV